MMNKSSGSFVLVLAPVKPGDFGPSGLAVYSDDYKDSRLIKNGDVVEAIGEIRTERERDYDEDDSVYYTTIAYRRVRLQDGFEGTTTWFDFNGDSGFKPV